MIKLPYTYEGRPLSEYGKRRKPSFQLRRRKSGAGRFFLFLLILLLPGGAGYGIWYFFFQDEKTEETIPAEETITPEIPAELPVTEPVTEEVATVVEQPRPVIRPAVQQNALSEEASRQAMKIYSAGVNAWRNQDHVKARSAMRLLLDKLGLPVNHQLYSQACTILNESSRIIYESGSDPAEWETYKVKSGDVLSRIARRKSTTVALIKQANGLTNDNLRIGQTLRIPVTVWRVRIDRGGSRVLLYGNGRLFTVYPAEIGSHATEALSGSYNLKSKQSDRLIFTSDTGDTVELYSLRSRGDNGNGIALSQSDLQELYKLTPSGMAAEITN